MSLVDGDVATAVSAERLAWGQCVGNGPAGAGFANSLDLVDIRLRTALIGCVMDSARRMDASTGIGAHPQRTPEAFLAASIVLSALAVSSPTALDLQHIAEAGLTTTPLTNGEVASAVAAERTGFQGTIGADYAEGPGRPLALISETADHTGWRLRSRLVPVLNDASRRMAVSLGWTPNPRTREHFAAGAVRLSLLAVSAPSGSDTLDLQRAGLA